MKKEKTKKDSWGEISAMLPAGKYARNSMSLKPGSNASVFVVNCSPSKERFLLKCINKTKVSEKELLGTEERALRSLSSAHVVKLIDVFENNKWKCLVFPFIEGQELDEQIIHKIDSMSFFSDAEIKDFGIQIAQAVIDMSKASPSPIIHQDIKPRNIRVDNKGKYTLLDLGIARFKDTNWKRALAKGAYGYSSPEQIYGVLDFPGRPSVTFSSDHWSIGTIMYQMATGKHPFDYDANKTLNGVLIDPKHYNPHLDDSLATIIRRLLSRHACDRYASPQALLDALNGKEQIRPTAFGEKAVLHNYMTTRIGRDFIKTYSAKSGPITIPAGLVVPERNIPQDTKAFTKLKGQDYKLMVDPETYLLVLKGGSQVTKKFFRQQHKDQLIMDTFAKQVEIGADYFVTPYFFIENLDDDALMLTTALYEEAVTYTQKQGWGLPLYGGLFMSTSVISNAQTRKKILNEVLASSDGLSGIYLVAECREEGSAPIKNLEYLIGLRETINTLSQRMPVVLAYGDVFALGMIPFGLTGIVAHPYASARKINMATKRDNLEKAEQRKKEGKTLKMKKTPPQYYAPPLLNFIRVSEELDTMYFNSMYGQELTCNCPFCDTLFVEAQKNKKVFELSWKDEDRYNHYMYHIVAEANRIKAMTPAKGKAYMTERIDNAIELYKKINASKQALHAHSQGDFLKSWKDCFK